MKASVFALILLLPPVVAAADILQWKDASGVTHYTNLKAAVPTDEHASVVVDEAARRTQSPVDEVAGPAVPASQPPEEPRLAQVVYDRSQLSNAYLEGLERGLEVGRSVATGGSVQINSPLVAGGSSTAPYLGYGGYGWPYSYPLLTTSFDRGRSRHLTLRLLLQDQFALDREGPFVFDERLGPPFGHPPLSVDLNPFLPRGLPHGFPRETRVVVR
jgi:uncharacterized protein DUF4124